MVLISFFFLFLFYLGGRPLNRLIQQQVLNKLAKLILDGGVRNNEVAHVGVNSHNSIEISRNHEAESDYEVEEPQESDDDMAIDDMD